MQKINNNHFNAGGGIDISSHYHGTDLKARDILLAKSAPGAFHDSGERFDPPKCHPRTRTRILTEIMDWVVGEVGWVGFIKWLYGPAGAGKSAIAQTIAEVCHARQLLLASFFFSRTDPKRNNEKCLIATIAYQIALNAPVTRDAIEAAVERDPAIFQRSIEAQLKTLIINPLTQLFQSTPVPNLIIIDGLDECNDHRVQQDILHALSIALQQPDVPLKFLICSRAEPHLTREFNSLALNGMATRLSLVDGYEQYDDIKRYLRDSFHKIATTHPLKAYIPSTWPTEVDLSTLVYKSSGQFIFAVTVINYISSDRHQPTRRLDAILGMQPSQTASDRPFAELDALYMGILSFVKLEDVRATLRLLGVLILCQFTPKSPKAVVGFMFLDPGEVERLLLDLASVVECVDMDTEIRMLHASFRDFLLDRSRSGEYCIDSSTMHKEIAQLCFSHIKEHESEGCAACLEEEFSCEALSYTFHCIIQHLSEAEPSSDLREALLNTCYLTVLSKFEESAYPISDLLPEFLFFLKSSRFTDTEDLYLHHRNIYDRIMRKRLQVADVSPEFGSILGLVFLGLHPNSKLRKCNPYLNYYLPAVEEDVSRIYQALYFGPEVCVSEFSRYVKLLTEFLTDPGRAGEFALHGPKYALAARILLDCFNTPCSGRNIPRFNFFDINACSKLIAETGILLSMASRSDELVTRINHADINCQCITVQGIFREYKVSKCEESLRILIKSIGDYLTRVVGSVPVDLKITLRVTTLAYGGPLTVGPLYYKDVLTTIG